MTSFHRFLPPAKTKLWCSAGAYFFHRVSSTHGVQNRHSHSTMHDVAGPQPVMVFIAMQKESERPEQNSLFRVADDLDFPSSRVEELFRFGCKTAQLRKIQSWAKPRKRNGAQVLTSRDDCSDRNICFIVGSAWGWSSATQLRNCHV